MTSTERTTYYSVLGLLIALLLPYTKHLLTAWGLRSAYILGLSFAISYLLTPVARLVASALNVVDLPGPRKVHAHPTPLMGGLAIYVAFVCAMSKIESPSIFVFVAWEAYGLGQATFDSSSSPMLIKTNFMRQFVVNQ